MAHLLGGENLHLEFPTRVVFDSVSLGVDEGARIGIVGRNGDGKSSLLAMLSGRLEPDGGRVTVRGGVRVGVLDQGDTLDDALTVAQTVVGDRPEHEWASDPAVRDVLSGLMGDVDHHAGVTTRSAPAFRDHRVFRCSASHAIASTSRWFVGSSRASTSQSPASSRASAPRRR